MGDAFRQIGHLTVLSYRDAVEMVTRMWQVLLVAIALLVAASLVGIVAETQIKTDLGSGIAGTLATIGGVWLASPYLVALYRFVLTGEVQRKPEILRGSAVAQNFFGWSAVLAFVTAAPGYALVILTPPGMGADQAASEANMPAVWVTFGLLIAVWIFSTRTVTLLPNAALGVATSVERAFAETRGRFWFIVGTISAVVLPIVFAGTLLGALMGGALELPRAILTILVLLVAGLSSTANIYKWLMDHPK
jgi:hypothetical protein